MEGDAVVLLRSCIRGGRSRSVPVFVRCRGAGGRSAEKASESSSSRDQLVKLDSKEAKRSRAVFRMAKDMLARTGNEKTSNIRNKSQILPLVAKQETDKPDAMPYAHALKAKEPLQTHKSQ